MALPEMSNVPVFWLLLMGISELCPSFAGRRVRRGKDLVEIAEGPAGSRPSADDVDASIHDSRPETMTCCRHRRHDPPCLACRIIRLVFTECAVFVFAAEHIDSTGDLSRSYSTTGSRKIRGASPMVANRIIHFRDGKILMIVAIQPSADRIDLPGEGRARQMIARRRQGCTRSPGIALRIVDLNCGTIGLPIVAADGVQLSFMCCYRQRTARSRHGRTLGPGVRSRIIGVHRGGRSPDVESRLPVPTDDIHVPARHTRANLM